MSGERQVRVLYDERTIAERTAELAREIAAVKPKDLLVVAILKGSFMFAADLLRALHRVPLVLTNVHWPWSRSQTARRTCAGT